MDGRHKTRGKGKSFQIELQGRICMFIGVFMGKGRVVKAGGVDWVNHKPKTALCCGNNFNKDGPV
jgi:hypothetical protein